MTGNVTLRYVGPFGFDTIFDFLNETLRNTTDPQNSPFLHPAEAGYYSITNEVCYTITQSRWWTWAIYDNQDIWNRIVVWKIPLITLLFQFARPPLASSFWANTNVLVLMRLVGNPISTIASLLATLHACQKQARIFQDHINHALHDAVGAGNWKLARRIREKSDALWKGFTLISISYVEWDAGGTNLDSILMHSLDQLLRDPDAAIMVSFETAASMLAADRSTFVLPVFIAQGAFLFAIGAAFWRVIGVPPQPHSWTNVEAYSIAMSAPFLYTLPAVFLAAIMGASQTETSVPTILNSLRRQLAEKDWHLPIPGRSPVPLHPPLIPAGPSQQDPGVTLARRIAAGGLYAWRPHTHAPRRLGRTWPHFLLAAGFVGGSVAVGGWIAYRVPPEGFDCRNAAQTALLGTWVASVALDFAVVFFAKVAGAEDGWYGVTFGKDVGMGLAVVVEIVVTQLGVLNRCDCFTLWGRVPLALPQIREVADVLMRRIAVEWPMVTFGWIGMEVVLCVLIWCWYGDAFRVYMQRDDGTSNFDWVPAWAQSARVRKALRGRTGGGNGSLELGRFL
ncbi:hypothetical protein B0H67DRAFT_673749 [Lasiosphaeris hirsuta]|uniref:Uncharacterized protein n=1 Tax=Lasiosphaeris hirsuta TaxID=260670 RepID=A0AA39ZVP5_9PEZI|nr:hypothetical protein B0H67DRAFT_673749 [Lasiosphaeris hirsuta]